MTSSRHLALRFSQIDDLKRGDHSYLTPEDKCFYLREYTPRESYSYSPTNDLIKNFKKEVNRRGFPEWHWKEWAVKKIAEEIVEGWGANNIRNWTLVPIPPSKTKEHPEYDNRLMWMLREISRTVPCNIRELIVQTQDMEAAHLSVVRASPDELARSYIIDESLVEPMPSSIAIVDDMLTAGAHFKACKMVLRERFPDARIIGVFVARVERL